MCIAQRLKFICEQQKWKIKEFAELVGIPYRTMQSYLSGDREPNAEGMTAIAKVGINLNWLVTGQGEIFISDQLAVKTLTKAEYELLDNFNKCNKIGKKAIEVHATAIAQTTKFSQK
ncbi:helix-turn-helix domain-containing protein [Psittacicella hinzii]|uniref:Transcriptional regulator n=1 Tax=Psittacicella hinzii TaxID=2028575 RepID=A0A3A1YS37_9GAMM|nr:helix-turn-helix transcriptional regulator [Psittacicella hinzii]RIY40306.1 transcriptional regulator [Psittacicella hinzii]